MPCLSLVVQLHLHFTQSSSTNHVQLGPLSSIHTLRCLALTGSRDRQSCTEFLVDTLTQLTTLELINCRVNQGLPGSLRRLKRDSADAPLSRLLLLEVLQVSMCAVPELSPALTRLEIAMIPADLVPSHLPASLANLHVADCATLPCLAGPSKLTSLTLPLDRKHTCTVPPWDLNFTPHLESLVLSSDPLFEREELHCGPLTRLTCLYVSFCEQLSADHMSLPPSLRELSMRYCELPTLSPLAPCMASLEWLDLSWNSRLSDVMPLAAAFFLDPPRPGRLLAGDRCSPSSASHRFGAGHQPGLPASTPLPYQAAHACMQLEIPSPRPVPPYRPAAPGPVRQP